MPLRLWEQVLQREYMNWTFFDALSVLAAVVLLVETISALIGMGCLSCNAKEFTLVRWGSGLYLADACRLMSIAVSIHCHRTTRGAGYTTPVSKAVSHGGCGIHLAWEGTTGKASPPYPVPQSHS